MKDNKKNNRGHTLRVFGIILIDICLINLAAFVAVMLRMELDYADAATHGFLHTLRLCCVPGTLAALLMFKVFGLYRSAWDSAGARVMLSIAFASI